MSNVTPHASNHALRRQDAVNRQHLTDEADHPQTRTFDAGMEFIDTNHADDGWMLQIETFDPHEPFFSYAQYHDLYGTPTVTEGVDFDWPDYKQVTESDAELTHLRDRYLALLSMCDRSLGRVLDAMDQHDLWRDTMLIVCTDHGLLLGEHGWLGKNVPPFYEETIHTPLFVWDPRSRVAGESRDALVQTIDFGPTLLDHFGLTPTADMQGRSLLPVLDAGTELHDAALFGLHGGHANVTDGRHVYMRACVTPDNQPLFDYTLMPTSMRGRFGADALRRAELVAPLPFTKGMPVLKVPAVAPTNPAAFGSQLFDLESDPQQLNPLVDDELELRMISLLVELMRANDAPSEQYERLGLPETGEPGPEHLVLARQAAQGSADPAADADLSTLSASAVGMRSVRELLADERARGVLRDELGPIVDGPLPDEALGMTLVQIATVTAGLVPPAALHRIAARL